MYIFNADTDMRCLDDLLELITRKDKKIKKR